MDFVSVGVLEPISHEYQEMTLQLSFGGVKMYTWIFDCIVGLAPLTPTLFSGQLYFSTCLNIFFGLHNEKAKVIA